MLPTNIPSEERIRIIIGMGITQPQALLCLIASDTYKLVKATMKIKPVIIPTINKMFLT